MADDKEMEESIKDSLRIAGVGIEYRNNKRSLSELGNVGQRIKEGLESKDYHDLIAFGKVWVCEGSSNIRTDFMHLFCRALLVHNISCRLVDLTTVMIIIDGADPYEEMSDLEFLLIDGFYEPHYEAAFTDSERYRLEWWLRKWLMSGRSLAVHTSATLDKSTWWSDSLIEYMKDKMVERFGA